MARDEVLHGLLGAFVVQILLQPCDRFADHEGAIGLRITGPLEDPGHRVNPLGFWGIETDGDYSVTGFVPRRITESVGIWLPHGGRRACHQATLFFGHTA
jgi:hypothetical protein